MGSVAVDAEHPGGGVEQRRHVAAGDGLVVLHRVDLGCDARSVPRRSVVIRPFHGHAKERMHVEFHDAAGPLVDVDVRVVAVCNGEDGVVDVLAGVVHRCRHADEVAGHHGSGTSRAVAVG